MLRNYAGKVPQIAARAYVDAAATVIGDVSLGEDASVWPGAVLRGDVHSIRVGARSNVQDNSVLHGMLGEFPVEVGDDVTIGHGVILHGCVIEARCLIGMGSIILNGAQIGADCIVAAGTLVPERAVIAPGSLVMGSPGKVRRELNDDDLRTILRYAERYVSYKNTHMAEAGAEREIGAVKKP
jgi:carbonic anhydrase/acetyltransferase-like protein (isoleucine patch superfamily)